jgi:endonuclease-3 related protein
MKDRRIKDIYDLLLNHYGDLKWWPANSDYEIMLGAILTQNTNWSNVEKAIANFAEIKEDYVLSLSKDELIKVIKPTGFYMAKAQSIIDLTNWYKQYSYKIDNVTKHDVINIRKELLRIKGIGHETADCILLYVFKYPVFVVDAYTKRLLDRYGIDVKNNYNYIQKYFQSNLEKDVSIFNNYHALIVHNAKKFCKKKPLCTNCPLTNHCQKIV